MQKFGQILKLAVKKSNKQVCYTPVYFMGAKAKEPEQQQVQQQQSGNLSKQQKLDKQQEQLLKKLRDSKNKYAATKDGYRVDVGLIIERLPIFYQVDGKELEYMKFKRQIQNKYKLKLEVPKDLTEFNEKHPTAEYERHDTENLITHQVPETRESYHKNSKVFLNTDPEIKDHKSIQYAGNYSVYLLVKGALAQGKQNIIRDQWHFPYQVVYERQSFNEVLGQLTNEIQQGVFTTHPAFKTPVLCEQRKIEDEKDPKIKGLKGSKCFYYQAYHLTGNIPSAIESQYKEFAWVPRRQLQNFLSKEQYDQFVKTLTD